MHGKVKLARNLETGENVAIKIIPRFSKKRRLGKVTAKSPQDKTKKEIAILKKIRHPNVVALLEVNDLKTYFQTDDGVVKAVDGVSFSVEKGKTLGIVGESGSGKSVTCLTIMGLNDRKNTITSGEALFNGENLLTAGSRRLREIRGNDIAMIVQDPMTSLNPVHTIGAQLIEAVQLHRDVSK